MTELAYKDKWEVINIVFINTWAARTATAAGCLLINVISLVSRSISIIPRWEFLVFPAASHDILSLFHFYFPRELITVDSRILILCVANEIKH